jgi:hypothetical protein
MAKNYKLFNLKRYYLILSLLFFSNAFSANWYVNDNSTAGDVYTTALGSDSNAGTSPSAPKLTLKAALDACAPGDTIFIDTGTYPGGGVGNIT